MSQTKVLYLLIYLIFICHSTREKVVSILNTLPSKSQFPSKCVPFTRTMPKILTNAKNKYS